MGVYLPIKDYSAMQGPAPDGFHVPTTDEWVALYGILNSTFKLGKNTKMMATYLKIPVYGSRSRSKSSVSGSSGYYWSCSPNPNSVEGAYCMYISSSCNSQYPSYRSMGFGVRCFKNLPAKPTSSWTTLYDGSSKASGAGIFRNSTEGLISASGDGITWYTIMDKNLGATTVYNNGDEKSEANCGGFFQWGNNYGFPFTGSVTTSSTRVNTSNYGPGNYYSSSTFITRANSPYDWSSVQNDNLWGATTGVKPMSELKNAYIGEYVAPIDTPGIYHNATLGLISLSSDGSTRYTMADKNLGATSTDVSSSASYGNYYQRGNNYGFTSSPANKANSQVNAGTYGPGNYYSSNIFRYKGSASWNNWDSSNNHNLRGGVTDTNASKKGPCNTGFHIPSKDEWVNLFNAFKALGTSEWSWNGDYMKTYLKLPYAGLIRGNNGNYDTDNRYWTATSYTQSSNYYYNAYCITFASYNISIDGTNVKTYGQPIRPFSDTAVQPDTSWTKLY